MTTHPVFAHVYENLATLEVDEIESLLRPLIKGMENIASILPAGSFLYRARKCDSTFHKGEPFGLNQIRQRPANMATIGRANSNDQSVFYCSTTKEPVFFEVPNLQAGDEIILSIWKTKSQIIVNNIGYTEAAFAALGAARKPPQPNLLNGPNLDPDFHWTAPADVLEKGLPAEENAAIRDILGDAFTRRADNAMHHYKLTNAVARLHLGTIINASSKLAGIMYPSVQMSANGDNIALDGNTADEVLEFSKASHIIIGRRHDSIKFDITILDEAIELDANEHVKWLGRKLEWSIKEQFGELQLKSCEGPDKFGDYDGSDGRQAHWQATDPKTGLIVDPA